MGREGLMVADRREHRRAVRVRVRSHRRAVHHVVLMVVRLVQASVAHRATAAATQATVHHPVAVLRAAHGVRRRHALLLLPPVAEPHAHHLLLQLQRVGQRRDLLRGRFGLLVEVLLQRPLDGNLNASAFLALSSLRRDLVDAGRRARRRVRLLQPLLQQRLELAHVLERQLQCLEPAYGGLREHVSVERAQRQAHVGLREAQLDPALFELFGERLEVVGRGRVLLAAGRLRVVLLRVRRTVAVHLDGRVRVAQHAVHHVVRAVVAELRRPGPAAVVVAGRDDGRRWTRVPGLRASATAATASATTTAAAGHDSHVWRRFDVQSLVRVVRVVRMVLVHAHGRGPRVHPTGRGRQRDRRRGRRNLMVMVVVMMVLPGWHVLQLAGRVVLAVAASRRR